ncbi:MAG: hypothetical protein LQ349_003740, partial [Xanthoria aureola]
HQEAFLAFVVGAREVLTRRPRAYVRIVNVLKHVHFRSILRRQQSSPFGHESDRFVVLCTDLEGPVKVREGLLDRRVKQFGAEEKMVKYAIWR